MTRRNVIASEATQSNNLIYYYSLIQNTPVEYHDEIINNTGFPLARE
jgi:hypothetical protein